MFKSIKCLSSTLKGDMRYYHYELQDSNFVVENMVSDGCYADIRIVIYEYSLRNLNIIYNLKLYFSYHLICKNYTNYWEAVDLLIRAKSYLNAYYPHLNFDVYYPCLKRHLDRILWTKMLK